MTFAYPRFPSQKTKERYLSFFKTLAHVLPCPACRREFSHETEQLTMETFRDMTTLSKWLVEAHNRINRRLGKATVPYAIVLRRYHP